MAATLKVVREGVGIELRRGRLDIYLDAEQVGSLEPHGSVETLLEPGQHTLQMRAGRYSSLLRTFEAADEEVVTFRCHPVMVWPRYVISLVKPDLGIALKRE